MKRAFFLFFMFLFLASSVLAFKGSSTDYNTSGNIVYGSYKENSSDYDSEFNLENKPFGVLSNMYYHIILGSYFAEEVEDTVPPVITDADNLNETTLPSGTTEMNVNVTTDEPAYCEYSISNMSFAFGKGVSFEATGGTYHSFTYSGLSDGSAYNVSVKCNDSYNNHNTEDWFISFDVNITQEQCLAETVSYWKLDENSGNVTGDSVDDHNGTIYGATWSMDGKVNSALSFDGTDDYVDAGNDASLDSENFTIEAWLYPLQWSGKPYRGIVTKRNAAAGMDWELYIDPGQSNRIRMLIGSSIVLTGDNTGVLPLSQWSHVAYTKSGSTHKLYFNGELEDENEYSVSVPTGDKVRIGVLGGDSTSNAFNGTIDEVALYNRSLSAQEIQQHYLNSKYYDNNYCSAYNAECGNGIIDVSEGCDDNNTNNGDGCSSCSIDAGYSCSGVPSSCIPDTDGDGVKDSVDACNNSQAPSGMMSYWALEDSNGTTAADSYDSKPGTLVNNPAWYAGKIGYGLNFTGNSQKVTTKYDLNETSGTWMLWVAPESINQQGAAIGSENNEFRILFYTTNKLYFRAGRTNAPATGYDISNWTAGEWHHLAMAWAGNGNTFYAYVDGEQIANETQNYYGGDNIVLGGTTLYFKGLIDEAAVYNKALTAEEISQHYNQTLGGNGYCGA